MENYKNLDIQSAKTTIDVVAMVNEDVRKANIKGVTNLIAICDDNKISFKHPVFIDDCYVSSIAKVDDDVVITTTPHYKEGEETTKGIKHFKTKHIAKIFNRMASAIRKQSLATIEDTTEETETEE